MKQRGFSAIDGGQEGFGTELEWAAFTIGRKIRKAGDEKREREARATRGIPCQSLRATACGTLGALPSYQDILRTSLECLPAG